MGLFSASQISVDNKIYFVCTGNICRSAYAEKSLTHKLKSAGNTVNLNIDSVGTHGLTGHPMDQETATVATENDIPIRHLGKRFDELDSEAKPLFLVMTREHRDYVLKYDATAAKRVYLLSEFAMILEMLAEKKIKVDSFQSLISQVAKYRSAIPSGNYADIADPYRCELEVHRRVMSSIDKYLSTLSEWLEKVS